jgi:hypothetical protein
MPANSDPNPAESLRRVHALLSDIPKLDSDATVDRYLKESGIDITKAQNKAKVLMAKALASRKLERARARRERRLQLLEKIKNYAGTVGQRFEELIASGDVEGAQILARKFEETHPDDIASLQEDLILLSEIGKDDDLDANR